MTASATARVVVLMPPEEKSRLVDQARRAGMSVGELVRRSVTAQLSAAELEAELEHRRPEVEALLEELESSHARAMAAVDRALSAVEETRRYLAEGRAARGAG